MPTVICNRTANSHGFQPPSINVNKIHMVRFSREEENKQTHVESSFTMAEAILPHILQLFLESDSEDSDDGEEVFGVLLNEERRDYVPKVENFMEVIDMYNDADFRSDFRYMCTQCMQMAPRKTAAGHCGIHSTRESGRAPSQKHEHDSMRV